MPEDAEQFEAFFRAAHDSELGSCRVGSRLSYCDLICIAKKR